MASTLSKIKETATRMAEDCQIKNPERLPFFRFLYYPKQSSGAEKALSGIESITKLRREQIFCLVVLFLLAWFLLSSMPQFLCQLMAVVYPIYATSFAIRDGNNVEGLNSWLVYWCVYGSFSLIDSILLPVLNTVTVYWLSKLLFLFYLVCTQPLGTNEIFEKIVTPSLEILERHFIKIFDGSSQPNLPKKKSDKKK